MVIEINKGKTSKYYVFCVIYIGDMPFNVPTGAAVVGCG